MKHARLAVAVLFLLLGLAGSSSAQDQATPYYTAGNQFYSQQNYDKAISYYQYAAKLNPNLWQAYQGLGNSYYAKGDKANALTNYQKALAINPNNPQLSSFTQSLQAQVGSAPPALPNNSSAASSGANPVVYSPTAQNKFEVDVNAGLALYSSQIGFGGGLSGYLPLDKHFFLGASAGFYTISEGESGTVSGEGSTVTASASSTVDFIEVLARAKYVLDGEGMKPYFFGGAGIVVASTSYSYSASEGNQSQGGGGSGGSTTDPVVALGGGLAFSGGKDMDFTVQLKEDIIFIPSQTVSETVDGVTESVSAGGGTDSFTALEGGIDFNL